MISDSSIGNELNMELFQYKLMIQGERQNIPLKKQISSSSVFLDDIEEEHTEEELTGKNSNGWSKNDFEFAKNCTINATVKNCRERQLNGDLILANEQCAVRNVLETILLEQQNIAASGEKQCGTKSLQGSSVRSSTPYTQSLPIASMFYELKNYTKHVSPVKNSIFQTSLDGKTFDVNGFVKNTSRNLWYIKTENCKRYSKINLERIRLNMERFKFLNKQCIGNKPSIAYCKDIELKERLRNFGILRSQHKELNNHNIKHPEKSSSSNSFQDFLQYLKKFKKIDFKSNIESICLNKNIPMKGRDNLQTNKNKQDGSSNLLCEIFRHAGEEHSKDDSKTHSKVLQAKDIVTVDQVEAQLKGNYQHCSYLNRHDSSKMAQTESSQKNLTAGTQNTGFTSAEFHDNTKQFINSLEAKTINQNHASIIQQQSALKSNIQKIMNRPESQLILFHLIKGKISKHGLLIQLANPHLTQSERESITAVLTITSSTQQNQYGSHYQHFINQFNHRVLSLLERTSLQREEPITNNLMPSIVLSRENLQAHTANIMRNACLKYQLSANSHHHVMKN